MGTPSSSSLRCQACTFLRNFDSEDGRICFTALCEIVGCLVRLIFPLQHSLLSSLYINITKSHMESQGESSLQRTKETSQRKKLLSFLKRRFRLFGFLRKHHWSLKRKVHLPIGRNKKFETTITTQQYYSDREEGGVSITVTPDIPRKALPCSLPEPLVSAGQEVTPEQQPAEPERNSSKSSAFKIKSKLSRFFIPGIEKRNQTRANAWHQNLGTFVGFGMGISSASQTASERQKLFQAQQSQLRKQIQTGALPQTVGVCTFLLIGRT